MKTYSYFGGLMHGIGSLLTGMKTTMTVFCRRKVTEQYPENRATLEMFDRFRGTLTMPHNDRNEHHCIACGLCQIACPNDTIKVTSEMIETEDGKKKRRYWQSMNTTSVRACSANFVSQLVHTMRLRLLQTLSMRCSTVQSW